jgi:hypothetical protein
MVLAAAAAAVRPGGVVGVARREAAAMTGLDVRQLADLVVVPTLKALDVAAPGIYGEVAVALLLGTAAQESRFRYLKQVGGPALGLFQMEPATHHDLLEWLRYGRATALRARFDDLFEATNPLVSPGAGRLVSDLNYATAMARLLYWRAPEPLPGIDLSDWAQTANALWPTYKKTWNSMKGAATSGQFIRNYRDLVKDHWPPEGRK